MGKLFAEKARAPPREAGNKPNQHGKPENMQEESFLMNTSTTKYVNPKITQDALSAGNAK